MTRALAGLTAAAIAICVAGCAMLPDDGPMSGDIVKASHGEAPASLPYALISVTPSVESVLARYSPRLSSAFADKSAPRGFRFGTGDLISISIFESAAGGLFTSDSGVRAGNYVTVPTQAVDERGYIAVPYAGDVLARGRTPSEIQKDIVAHLKDRALEPQVVVSLAEQRTSLYSVLGDVRNAGRFPASPSGERVLDAVARAGGPANQGYDTWVALERTGHRASIPFGALLYEPTNNIFVLPNDAIFVYSQPQTFVAFGAGGAQGQFKFEAWRISLAEALAKQGGLNDSQADPASVFLYRGEPRNVAREIGVDVDKFEGKVIPVIYQLNLRDPSGYFLAQDFQMRNKDVIFSSNASSVETTKFLTFIRTILATVNDPIVYATNGFSLVATAKGTSTATIINTPTPITQAAQ